MLQVAIELSELANIHEAMLGGKRFIDTYKPDGSSRNSGGSGGGFIFAPPWVEAPQDFLPFDESGQVNLPASPSADTLVMSFRVPTGYDGVIKAYSLNFGGGGFVSGSGDIVWRIKLDGKPLRNFSNILSEKGSTETPREIRGGIRLYSGQLVEFYVNHAANVALNGKVLVSATGWFYPAKGQ